MRMIRIGNLLGNTWDLLLYRISRGRWGAIDPRAIDAGRRPVTAPA